MATGTSHQADGCDGNTLVDDGYTYLPADIFSCGHQILCQGGYLLIYLLATGLQVLVGTLQQVDAHGDGADVQGLLFHHLVGFENFVDADHMCLCCLKEGMYRVTDYILCIFSKMASFWHLT